MTTPIWFQKMSLRRLLTNHHHHHRSSNHFLRTFATGGGRNNNKKNDSYMIPGMSHQYGSLGDTTPTSSISRESTAWQASHNTEVQRVTQKAMIYELIHEQTRTIESVVPWFLENMPAV